MTIAADRPVELLAQPTVEQTPLVQSRLEQLLDEGSLVLLEPIDRSGALCAEGTIHGVPVVVFSTDPQVMGGAMGAEGCARMVHATERAVARGVPVIGIWHSGGARLQDGVASLDAVGQVFAAQVRASGVVPQISLVLGPAAGGAAYGPALTDIVVMGPDGRVFVTGPDVVRKVTGEEIDMVGLGGPDSHGKKSGVAHVTAKTNEEAMDKTRALVELLGRAKTKTDKAVHDPDMAALMPDNPRVAYDVRPLVRQLLDAAPVELSAKWAPNIVTALGRLEGRTVGVVANNPSRLAGCLNSEAAEKAARFVRFCDSQGVPLVVLVDVPGYLPGSGQEWNGVVRRGAKLLYAFTEATVPRVTVVTRKAYGGAYIAMNSKSLGATRVLAWPTSEVAVMSAAAAVEILHRKSIASTPEELREAHLADLIHEHEKESGGVAKAVALDLVDEIVEPGETRKAIAAIIAATPARRGRHGNIPL